MVDLRVRKFAGRLAVNETASSSAKALLDRLGDVSHPVLRFHSVVDALSGLCVQVNAAEQSSADDADLSLARALNFVSAVVGYGEVIFAIEALDLDVRPHA